VQPFKQVFRELYVLTEGEKEDGGRVSRRYAGQQVEPRKGAALLGGRQWLIHHDVGVQRTFHEEGITASLTSEADWLGFLGSASITPAYQPSRRVGAGASSRYRRDLQRGDA
jgi:hypothetical protein